jgi:hypothetical protein
MPCKEQKPNRDRRTAGIETSAFPALIKSVKTIKTGDGPDDQIPGMGGLIRRPTDDAAGKTVIARILMVF